MTSQRPRTEIEKLEWYLARPLESWLKTLSRDDLIALYLTTKSEIEERDNQH